MTSSLFASILKVHLVLVVICGLPPCVEYHPKLSSPAILKTGENHLVPELKRPGPLACHLPGTIQQHL